MVELHDLIAANVDGLQLEVIANFHLPLPILFVRQADGSTLVREGVHSGEVWLQRQEGILDSLL